MKHMACEKIALLGVFAIAGCYSYASDAINNSNYNTAVAAPNFVNIKSGDSDQVIVRLTNENGFGAITGYTVSAVGAGIRVDSSCTVPDLTPDQQHAASCNGYYRPVFDASKDTLVPSGPSNQAQFYVVGLATGQYTFTVTPKSVNTSVSTTVTVVVQAITLGPALSKTTGVAGDTVVITAPAGSVFSSTSAVTFATGQVAIVGRSADSTTITLVAGPGITGAATVTKVGVAANPAVPPVTLVTTNALTTPQITVAPTTLSTTTPAFGASFTVTLGGGLRFTSSSVVKLGGTVAPIFSRSADSSSVVVAPFPGITGGLVSYTGIVLSFLNTVPLSVPGNQTATIGPITSDPNTLALATAPTITLPAPGFTTVVTGSSLFGNGSQCPASASPDGCALYTFVADTTVVLDINLNWTTGADMGLYHLNSTGGGSTATGSTGSCDTGGEDAPGETCTYTLAAGTYFFAVDFFGPIAYGFVGPDTTPPPWFQFSITRH